MSGLMDPREVERALESVSGWAKNGTELRKTWTFSDFEDALEFANAMGDIAEDLNHHPEIRLHDYNEVTLIVTTHDAGGITEKDLSFVEHVEKSEAITMAKETNDKTIKELVEELNKAEIDETESASKLAKIITEDNVDEINDLPLLYRMEVKKVLEERQRDDLAKKIKV